MSRGLRLSLLLLVTGCTPPALLVSDADWATVPAAQRATVDRQATSELTAARAEVTAATASLAELQRTPAPAIKPATPVAAAPAGDAWATTLRDHERARSAAIAQIDAATAARRRADLIWRQRRLEAATQRVDVVRFQRELVRAQTIDRNLLGDDTYETAPLRGQFSRAQQRWYAAANVADQARGELERAGAALSAAKEAYALLMRNGPGNSTAGTELVATADQPPPLLLPGWTVTRADIRRRRGLRHFLDDTGKGPQLRTSSLQMSLALRAWQPPAPAAEAKPTAAGARPPAAEPRPLTADARSPAAATTGPALPAVAIARPPAPTKPAPLPAKLAPSPAPAAKPAEAVPAR